MGEVENKYNLSPEDLEKERELLELRERVRLEFGGRSVEYRKAGEMLRRLRQRDRVKKWREKNPEYGARWRAENKEKISRYYLDNKEEWDERTKRWRVENKEKLRRTKAKWNAKNPGYHAKYATKRKKIDPLFKFRTDIRSLLCGAFKKKNYSKKSKAFDILGEEFEFVLMHLIDTAEKRYGFYDETQLYHIDHIVPLASATTEEEVTRLNHWTNLQYLTPEDNLKKGAKLL